MHTAWGGQEFGLKWLSLQIFQVLSLNTTEGALAQVKNLKTDPEMTPEMRGPNAWRKLCAEHKALTGQRLQGLVSRIFTPSRAKKNDEVKLLIESWEAHIHEYQAATNSKLHESNFIHGLRQMVPTEMEKDLYRLSTSPRACRHTP